MHLFLFYLQSAPFIPCNIASCKILQEFAYFFPTWLNVLVTHFVSHHTSFHLLYHLPLSCVFCIQSTLPRFTSPLHPPCLKSHLNIIPEKHGTLDDHHTQGTNLFIQTCKQNFTYFVYLEKLKGHCSFEFRRLSHSWGNKLLFHCFRKLHVSGMYSINFLDESLNKF